jgi:hypothetical protein
LALVVAAATLGGGCTSYATRLFAVRESIAHGDLYTALDATESLIAQANDGRQAIERDLPLLLLERAALHQAMQEHDQAVADFTAADPMINVLSLTQNNAGNIGEYLWSDSADTYQAPIYEKLMINVAALGSFLALGDYSGAMVEARRILVYTDLYRGTNLEAHPMIGAALMMAGLAMELGGERGEALRLYLDAWEIGAAPGLAESIASLAPGTTLAHHSAVDEARAALGLGPDDPAPERAEQEVVAIVFSGLAPYREAQHFPVGVVFNMFRDAGYYMSPEQEAAYLRATAEDVLTWVNYPVLLVQSNPLHHFRVSIDGKRAEIDPVADVESFALAQWERDRPAIALAAITRAIARIVAREAVQGISTAVGQGSDAARTVGFLLGLAAQGAMQAADRVDTRTWQMMPAFVSVARIPVSPGTHTLMVRGSGADATEEQSLALEVDEGERRVATFRFVR